MQRMMRSTKNFFASCFGAVQKTDEIAKIKYKENMIMSRQKQFGIEYLDLKKKGATPEELEAAVAKAVADVDKIQAEIEELRKEMQRIDELTKSKIQPKPGATTTTATPADTTTETTPADTTTTTTAPEKPQATTKTQAPTPAPADAGAGDK